MLNSEVKLRALILEEEAEWSGEQAFNRAQNLEEMSNLSKQAIIKTYKKIFERDLILDMAGGESSTAIYARFTMLWGQLQRRARKKQLYYNSPKKIINLYIKINYQNIKSLLNLTIKYITIITIETFILD